MTDVGLYGDYADNWTCPRCDAENDREFCHRCRCQKPFRSAQAIEAAADGPVARAASRPPGSSRGAGLMAAVLIGVVALALVVGVPLLRSAAETRQARADRAKATKLTIAAGELPAGFHQSSGSAAPVRVPTVVQDCVLGGATTDNARASAAYTSAEHTEVVVAAQVVNGVGEARDMAAAWSTDGFRTCLGRELAVALSARPVGVVPLPVPSIGEQAVADRVTLALGGGPGLVVDVVAVQSGRAIVTVGFAGANAVPDALRVRVIESVGRAL